MYFLCGHIEICAVSKVSKKEIGRVFKLILKALETNVELITTGDFMVRRSYHYDSSLLPGHHSVMTDEYKT